MDTWLIAVIVGIVFVFLYLRRKWYASVRPTVNILKFPTKYPDEKGKDRPHYDVICVGCGPAGSTMGYYMGKRGRKVLILEKATFPRDKICGDALCKTGIEIIHEMGVYDELKKENKMNIADAGGMVSPCGLSYIGRSKEIMGEIPGAIAIKRMHLDEKLAYAARKAGADLRENHAVKSASFDKSKGLWTVTLEGSDETFTSRVLVCADGAPSKLAQQLGLVKQPPQTSCSRCYIESGTHKFMADGVLFYNKELLPGYSCLFRHANDEANFCIYLIPGNPNATDSSLAHWHEHMMKNDPNISRALGSNIKHERMKAAALRIGGEEKTFDDHVLVIGDAAGFTDPMTGEGIHTAMDSGRIAANVLEDALTVGNFDAAVMEEYQNRWLNAWGTDFYWSMVMIQMAYKFPILMDAATAAMIRKGDRFLARWADIMTGRVTKFNLLYPDFVIVITYELIVLIIKRMLGMKVGGKGSAVKGLVEDKKKKQ